MPESIINKQTEENIKKYLENKSVRPAADIGNIFTGNDKKNINKKKIIAVAAIAFLIIFSSMAYFSFYKGQNIFDEKKVAIQIDTSKEVASGSEISMDISYKNDTQVELDSSRLSLVMPDGFIFKSSDIKPKEEKAVLSWEMGKIAQGKAGKVKIFGKLIGKKGSEHKFSSFLAYRPSNINSEYKSGKDISITISSTPFEFSIKTGDVLKSGDDAEYIIHYKNISARKFSSVKIKALAPAGFEYGTSEPAAIEVKDSVVSWDINNIDAGSEGNLTLKGRLSGVKDEEKKLEAFLSVSEENGTIDYGSAEAKIRMEEIPIVISQTINGESNFAADKNSELEYKIKFKNIGSEEIKGLIINSEIEGNVDFASVVVKQGSFDGKNKITWSAFNVPKLAALGAGEEDEVTFKIKINDIFKVEKNDDKNFLIKNKVSIKNFSFSSGSSEVGKTISSNISEVKVKAFPVIKQTAFYNDDQRISNSGLIPPEVGEETTYTVHWNLSNLFNDITGVRVFTMLPENVRWMGSFITSDGNISRGDESNGTFTPEVVDSSSINSINGKMGSEFGVGYNWYDSTVYGNQNHKGLPSNLKTGDVLNFTYSDGNIEQAESCTIESSQDGHSFFCTVQWKVDLPRYAEKELYHIEKAVSDNGEAKEKLYYNTSTREVVWLMPKAQANMGIVASPAKEVVFQVGVIPRETDVGNTMLVVDKASVSGYDDFALDYVSNVDGEISSDLPDDDSIGLEEGVVVSVGGES